MAAWRQRVNVAAWRLTEGDGGRRVLTAPVVGGVRMVLGGREQ